MYPFRYFDLKVLMIIIFMLFLIFSFSTAGAQDKIHRHKYLSLSESIAVVVPLDDFYTESERFNARRFDVSPEVYFVSG